MYLFSYGTLQEKNIQEGLFGQEVSMIDGKLEDYVLSLGVDGFYNLEPLAGHWVEGKLLELDQDQILCADQWEEVPVYEREIKYIATEAGLVEGWVFFKTEEQVFSYPDNSPDHKLTSGFEGDELNEIFNTFLKLKTMKTGFVDVYCAIELLKNKPENKKLFQNIPTEISEFSLISLPYEGYDIKHIAFTVRVSVEDTYVVIGVPVSIRTPEEILKSIFENKVLLENRFSVALAETSKAMLFKSRDDLAEKIRGLSFTMAFETPFLQRFEEEKKVILQWLKTLSL